MVVGGRAYPQLTCRADVAGTQNRLVHTFGCAPLLPLLSDSIQLHRTHRKPTVKREKHGDGLTGVPSSARVPGRWLSSCQVPCVRCHVGGSYILKGDPQWIGPKHKNKPCCLTDMVFPSTHPPTPTHPPTTQPSTRPPARPPAHPPTQPAPLMSPPISAANLVIGRLYPTWLTAY